MAENYWTYPSSLSRNTIISKSNLNDITDSELDLLFSTFKGERAFFKSWGSRLLTRIGETRHSLTDAILANEARQDIIDNLPNIEPLSVRVNWDKATKTYSIDVIYFNRLTAQERFKNIIL